MIKKLKQKVIICYYVVIRYNWYVNKVYHMSDTDNRNKEWRAAIIWLQEHDRTQSILPIIKKVEMH